MSYITRIFKSEHDRIDENLSAYLDGMLNPRERTRVERHLESCEECRAELEGLKYTINLVKLAPEVSLPRSFLVPLSEARSQAAVRRGWAFPVMRMASAMATFLFVIVLSGNLLFRLGYLPGASQPAEPMLAQQTEQIQAETPPAQAVGIEAAPSGGGAEAPGIKRLQVVTTAPDQSRSDKRARERDHCRDTRRGPGCHAQGGGCAGAERFA